MTQYFWSHRDSLTRSGARNATASVFHQRHLGRVLRSPRDGSPDEELHRHAAENLDRADALLFGRVTYEMMEAAWRSGWRATGREARLDGALRPDDRRGEEVRRVEHLERVDWNAELVRGDLGRPFRRLKREPGKGLAWEA